MKFGTIIKAAREKAPYTQAEVARLVTIALRGDGALNQGTLSAWESGRQMPSPDKWPVVAELAELLGLDSGTLRLSLDDKGTAEERAEISPDEIYARNVRKLVEQATSQAFDSTDSLRIWFIAPHRLPGFSDPKDAILNLWRDNLAAGVHYKLLWVKEVIHQQSVFTKLEKFLAILSDNFATPAAGSVTVYFLRTEEVEHSTSSEIDFKSYALEWLNDDRKPNINVSWIDLGRLTNSDADRSIKEDLSRWFLPIQCRLALFIPHEKCPVSPRANILLFNTKETCDSSVSSNYRWLEEGLATELKDIAIRLEAWINRPSRTIKKN